MTVGTISNITADKAIYMSLTGIVGFFADIKTAIIGLLLLIATDTVTGFFAASPENRNSHRLRRVVKKTISYITAIVIMHILEKLIFPDYGTRLHLELARLTATIISGIEVYSVLENFYALTGLRVFRLLTQLTTKKLKQVTDTDITE